MVDERTALLAIAGMTVVTYLTRVGGLWAMALVTPTPRVEAALRALSGSVLVALVVPVAVHGGPAFLAATVGAGALAVRTRRSLLAMACGVALAAGVRRLILGQ